MKRVSRALSSSIEASRSARCSGAMPSPNLRSVVTAPVIVASGVRRSCDSEASKVPRSFSFSSSATVRTESLTSNARSMAIAACSRMRLRRVLERRRNRRIAVGRLEAANADDAARGDERTELEAHVGKRAGLPTRRFALVEGPARGAVLAGVERVDRRPGGAQRQLAVFGQQHDDAARPERLVGVDGRRIEDVVERRGAGELARELEQRALSPGRWRAPAAPGRAPGRRASRPGSRRRGR